MISTVEGFADATNRALFFILPLQKSGRHTLPRAVSDHVRMAATVIMMPGLPQGPATVLRPACVVFLPPAHLPADRCHCDPCLADLEAEVYRERAAEGLLQNAPLTLSTPNALVLKYLFIVY